jgi:hypothetical protein
MSLCLPVNAKQGWPYNDGGMYLVSVSWFAVGQQFLRDFFCRPRWLSISWKDLQIVCQPSGINYQNNATFCK